MELFNFFERIYIVNLPERADRRAQMIDELNRIGLKVDDNHIRFFKAIRPDAADKFPSLGARGCFLSHLDILREAERDGLNNILVLEDDLSIDPRLSDVQLDMLVSLKYFPWDFAYLGHVEATAKSLKPPHWIRSTMPIATTHFYGLSRRAICTMREHLEACMQREPGHPLGSPMHIDGAYSLYRSHHPELVTLMAVPSLGEQRSSRSDIYPNRWYDRLTGFRQLVAIMRAGKNWAKWFKSV